MQCTLLLLAISILTSSFVEMSPVDYGENTLVTSLCPNITNCMLQRGVSYGIESYRYLVSTNMASTDITIAQAFLLSLLQCLVTRDMLTYSIFSECSYHIEQLQSRHLGLWLREDFRFPADDMVQAMATLDDIYSNDNGSIKLPAHVLIFFSSLADVYGITSRSKEEYKENDLMRDLENAVINNNACEIIVLATKGGNVNGSTKSGDRLIHLAVKTSSRSSIAALGYLKADLEVRNSAGATPMEEAIQIDSIESIKELLLAGAQIEKRLFKGNTYLHIAAISGKNNALLTLLDEGLPPNRKNYLGETSLLLALRSGNVRGVEILLQRGADPDLVSKSGKSPFQIAIQSKNVKMFRTLINARLSPDLHLGNGDSLVHLIVRSGNATEMLKILKGRNFQFNVRNNDGLAPLHIATNPSIVRMLLRMGADVNFKTAEGETALHLASKNGSLELVEALVQHGAGVDIQDSLGNTALMAAAKNSSSDIVNFLLNNGANPRLKSETGETVLHSAAEGGCAICVTILIEAGANVDERKNNGENAVFYAVRNDNLTVLRSLLEHGADPGIVKENGWTPLTIASANGELGAVKLLVEKGAPLTYKNGKISALSAAVYNGHKEVEDYLRSKGAIE